MQDVVTQFPCLGLSILGLCSYNPAQPANIYFGLGDAISALGFTLAIQQFLKPIYLFRLQAYGIKLRYLFLCIFLGFLSVVIAAILPNLPIPHDVFLAYPIVWEILGAVLIGSAYGLTAFISLRPAHINNFNLISFVRAAGHLLSKADDADRVSFAEDLLCSIPRLIVYATAWRRAEGHATGMEFERLREIGEPLSIRGQPEVSAFYTFTHRQELERASYAATFLRLISDTNFCSALVCKCPWLTASIVREVSERQLYVPQAEIFVQEVAYQAVVNGESIMAREVDYYGFGAVPLLSESLFGDWFILSNYDPLQKLCFGVRGKPSEGYIARLNGASKMMLETAIDNGDYWPQQYMYSVEEAYKSWFMQLRFDRHKGIEDNSSIELYMGIKKLYEITQEGLESMNQERRRLLFIADPTVYRRDLVDVVASIVYSNLESFANSFKGFDDENWHNAIGIFHDLFPFHATTPAGLNPLQQQLAIQLIDKLRRNMDGWYPSISRVLLAAIGPYEGGTPVTVRTAYVILKDAVYKELQKLPELHAKKPDKVADFLPSNVTYNVETNTLAHAYSDGETQMTNLSALTIPEINLTDESNWQI